MSETPTTFTHGTSLTFHNMRQHTSVIDRGPQVSFTVKGAAAAKTLVTVALESSVWFECTPCPDDLYVVTVKNEAAPHWLLDRLVEAEGPVRTTGGETQVFVMPDDSPENPNHDDYGYTMYSFSHRHTNYKNPDDFELAVDEFGDVTSKDEDLQEKLDTKRAFILSYYEHGAGTSTWSLKGEGPACGWDSSPIAGILLFDDEEVDNFPMPEASARGILKTYSEWCRGEVYGIETRDREGVSIDSLWGVYEDDLEDTACDFLGLKAGEVELVRTY